MKFLVALLSILSLALVINGEIYGETPETRTENILGILRLRARVLQGLIKRDCPGHIYKRSVHVPIGVSIEVEEGVVKHLQETLVKCRQHGNKGSSSDGPTASAVMTTAMEPKVTKAPKPATTTIDPSQLKMETVRVMNITMVHMERDLGDKNSILFSSWDSFGQLTDFPSPTSPVKTLLTGYKDGSNFTTPFIQLRDFKPLNKTTIIGSDTGAHCMRLIDRATLRVSTLAGKCGEYGFAVGSRFETRFRNPIGIEIVNDDLFICDYNNKRVKKLDLINGTVSYVGVFSSRPREITADPQKRFLYISANTRDSLQRIDLSNYEKVRLIMHPVGGYQDGPFSSVKMSSVRGITFLTETTLAIVDAGSQRVRIIDLVNQNVWSLCHGKGTEDGDIKTCGLSEPYSVTVIDDYLYIGTKRAIRRIPVAAIASK